MLALCSDCSVQGGDCYCANETVLYSDRDYIRIRDDCQKCSANTDSCAEPKTDVRNCAGYYAPFTCGHRQEDIYPGCSGIRLPYRRSFPCMEATYPYAIKNQRKARNAPSRGHFVPKPLVGGFGCLELVLYGIRELA